ncbi:hypothetical protein AB3U99_18705 [Niallia sp. JL1B1071]|uniref:hypothetical protein n=1 Tax=Niallia tiangongensis TaxID=3237105 RepID=UPI0037DD437F
MMKRRALSMSFMQVYTSKVFYLAIIGVTVLCFISVWDSLKMPGVSVSYLIEIFIGLAMFKKIVVLFAAIPFVSSFCSDWKCQYIKPVIIRSGINKYIRAKIITCFVTGLITVFLGLLLFILLLSFRMPIFPIENFGNIVYLPFSPLATSNFPISYLIARCFVFSLSAALWSVVGLTVSAFIPIHFVAIASTVIASYFLEQITYFYLPDWLNLYKLTGSEDVIHQGPYISLFYFIFVFVSFSALAGLLFQYQVKRRINNEVV